MKRAAITDLGIVSSIGNNQQEVLVSLREGRSRITFSQELKDSGMCNRVWGNIKLDTTDLIDRKVMRFTSDASTYAFLSMGWAIVGAGLSPEAYQSNPHVGLIAGSGGGSPRFQMFNANAVCGPHGPKAIGPYMVTKAVASGISAYLATPLKVHGVNYPINPACATSAHCTGSAVRQIQPGRQDIMPAGDGEGLRWEMACEFGTTSTLSTKYSNTPKRASRVYDAHRNGFVIVGGGGMVVVEELEHALARGAHIYAEVVGYGATFDDAGMIVPSGGNAVRCIKIVMHDVGTPIDYLNSHDTPTPVGDVKELATIHEVFGDKNPAISATKAMTGYPLGTAGVQEAIYSLLMLEHGLIAPSTDIEELDEQAAGLNIVTGTTGRELATAMSSGFGFGDANAMLVIHKLKD